MTRAPAHCCIWIAAFVAFPASAAAEDEPTDPEDPIQLEARLGWQRALMPDSDSDYWPVGGLIRMQIPMTSFGASGVDDAYTEVGLSVGYEFHPPDTKQFRRDRHIPDSVPSSTDPLWALDAGLFGRYWACGTCSLFRFGAEARVGFGFVSGANFRYLGAEGYDRPWGIGPAAGATFLVALGPVILGAGLRWQVADGVMGIALPVLTVGMITPKSMEPSQPKKSAAAPSK
jgi:hypothetical protein